MTVTKDFHKIAQTPEIEPRKFKNFTVKPLV